LMRSRICLSSIGTSREPHRADSPAPVFYLLPGRFRREPLFA
jgi:hypothetical protein